MKLLKLLICLIIPLNVVNAQPPAWDPNKIITDPNLIDFTVMRDGTWDGYLFQGITFADGLNIRGQTGIYFYDCTFIDEGVKLSYDTDAAKANVLYTGNTNITFDNCTFKNVTANGIVTEIRDSPFVDHPNLVIKNSTFRAWGEHDSGAAICPPVCDDCDRTKRYNNNYKDTTCVVAGVERPFITGARYCTINQGGDCERCHDPYNKFDHALYIRATGVLVENNEFIQTTGGSAISIRNTGTIRGNKIYPNYNHPYEGGVGTALAYWDQYDARGNKELLIENNVIIGKAQDVSRISGDSFPECNNSQQALVGLNDFEEGRNAVDNIIFRFNTLVMLPGLETIDHYALSVRNKYGDFNTPNSISIYGNLVVDLRDTQRYYTVFPETSSHISIDEAKNLFTDSDENFTNCDWNIAPYDVRLQSAGSAWNFNPLLNSGEPVPSLDKDGINRPSSPLSAGAYQYADALELSSQITENTIVGWTHKINISSSVENNAQLEVRATESVNLKAGFSIETGSSFELKLACNAQNQNARTIAEGSSKTYDDQIYKKDETLLFYPNPTARQINFPQPVESIMIFDQTGKVIISQRQTSLTTLDISRLNPGMYYVRMTSKNRLNTQILIKK